MFTLPYELSALYALLIGASLYDLRERRVPNALNAVLTLGGFTYRFMNAGGLGALESLLGVGMALALLLVPFMLYVYRGGDVKLCMGAGAWLGWEQTLWVIVYGVLIGGVFGLLQLVGAKLSARYQAHHQAHHQASSIDEELLTSLDHGSTQVHTVPMALAFTLAVMIVTHTP